MKKLPKVFANNLSEVHNNDTVFYSNDTNLKVSAEDFDDRSSVDEYKTIKGNTVIQKINEIFKSPYYIYKAEVEITLEDGVVVKKIIGKNNQNLITMDNELIPINSIKDIKYK